MSTPQHVLRKQTLRLRAGSQALAVALQPRLGDFNRQRLLPVIEKVFDEMDVPGRHVRIDRLEIDLGRFSLASLEGEAERRLEGALRQSLEKALRDSPGQGETARSREESRREMLEHCLVHGTRPWWAPRQPSFSLEALFLEMAAEDPKGLVASVHDLGRDRRVQERLAAQLGEPALRRLVRMLEPEHALLIFTYLGNVREVHRGEPVLPLSERALARALWVLTQAYLLNDPGSQFNRRSFVRSLLRGLAAREGLRYEEILAALLRGLERTARTHPVRSSLPAVLEELALATRIDEAPSEPEGDPDDLDDTWVQEATPPSFDCLLDRLCPREAGALRTLLRVFACIPAPYRPRPEALVRQAILGEALHLQAGQPLGAESFERVLRELFAAPLAEPVHRVLMQESAGWPEHGNAFRTALSAVSAPRPDEDPRQPLLAILAGPPEAARVFLRRHGDRRTRERWVKLLPESALVRMAEVLEPRKHRVLLSAAEVLAAAWTETAPRQHPDLTDRRAFWSFLLGFLTSSRGRGLSVERLVAAFFEHTAASSPSASRRGETGARLLEAAGRLARTGGHTGLATALHRRQPARKQTRPRRTRSPEPADETETLYVGNAGLVLASPFLPHLLKTLDLFVAGEDGGLRPRDGEAASRAVHLLQFLVDGRVDTPEPDLVLNKVLCGVPVATAVDREIVPTERELDVCGQLLRSMIANWAIISNTSVAGLQETFLRREGRLQQTGGGWKLQVQRKTVDVLVDQVPWNVSVIFNSWMPHPLHVTW